MTGEEGKRHALTLLTDMQETLHAAGLDRLPQKSDFTPDQLVQIKAHLGPFPRALEAAGLKEPRDAAAFAERRLQKRIAAKRRKTAAKIQKQQQIPKEPDASTRMK